MSLVVLSVLGGLVLLLVGGELLVRGSVRAASALGVSPLLIGLTLVGFGTSTPELVTSVQASFAGSPGIAVGNVVGSNTANLLLILGVVALVVPVPAAPSALRRDGSVMVVSAALLVAVAWYGQLNRVVGLVLVAGLVAYLVYAVRTERNVEVGAEADPPGGHTAAYDKDVAAEALDPGLHPAPTASGLLVPVLTALVGLGIVIVGARFLVDGSVSLAGDLGVSDTVIGLTVVAIGTSMPELVASLVAALRGQPGLALGNVLGSCIYNAFGIGGLTGVIAPVAVPEQIATFDGPVMLAAALLVWALMWSGRRVNRWEGAALLAGYVAYTVVLVTR